MLNSRGDRRVLGLFRKATLPKLQIFYPIMSVAGLVSEYGPDCHYCGEPSYACKDAFRFLYRHILFFWRIL